MTVLVAGTVDVEPDTFPAFVAAAKPMIVASLKEPGCLDYGYGEQFGTPYRVKVFEKWRDKAALDAHFATPHMAKFLTALKAVRFNTFDVHIYEIADEAPMPKIAP